MAINWDKVKKQAEEQEKTGRTTRGKGVYNNNAAAAPKRDAGVPAIADAPADVYGGVFDVNPDSFATEATGKAKPSAARNAVLSGLAGTGSSLSKNTSLLLGGMAQGREDAAEHITTPAWLTKGSIYANRGYDPMNPERSEQETRNLQAASSLANEMARDLRAKEQMLDAQAKENLGAVGTAAYDLTKMGTQIVGDAVANRLLPGAGLLSMGQRSFGQGVMAAEDEGITGTRAIAYGAGTAAIEMATEKISAIAKPLKAIYGKGLVDDMIQNLTKTAKGNRVLSVLGSAAGEGAEEAIASVLQVPLQNITLQNGAAYDAQWLADTAYEALLGGLMGGAFGVASIPGEIAQERRNNAVQQLAEEMARESMQNATQSAPAPMQTAEQAQMPAENKMAQRAIQTAKAASVEDAASQFGEAGAQVYKAGYRDTGDDAQYFGDFYKAYQAGMRGEAAPKSSLTDTETAAAHAAGVSDAKRSAQAAYFGKDSQLVRDDKWKRAHLSTKDSRKLDALAKVLGVKIRFVDSIDETVQNELGETEVHKSVANAQYSNGEILLALDAENPVMVSVVHEAVHRLRETNPAEYASLVQFVQNNMSSGALNWAINRRGEDYKGADRTELTEEVVADAFGQLINDTALLDQFVKDNRTVAEKLLDSIRDMINAIKRALNKQNLQLTENQKAEFQELYDNLYGAEKLLGNALNVSAENVEKRGNQEYTGDKETKHSRKDSADHGIEENRRHAIEVLRGSGTLKWSQINEEKRIAYERRSAFAGRIAKAGAVEKTVGNVLYGYRPVPVSAASKYAREVIEELRKFGINDAFVFEGEVQANHLGKTISDAAECMTLLDGAIGIKDEAKMDAKNVAAHEAIHYKKKKGDPDVVTYEETVINNVDLSSDLFQKYYDAINDTYFSGGLDWGNQKDVAKFVDEFSAYVGGHLYSGAFDVSGMFVDMAEVVPALEKSLGVTLSTQSNIAAEQAELSDVNVKFSLRKKEPPKNVGIAYKVFYAKNGQLYPPMVANPGGEGTPVGVWLDADVGVAAAPSKTGRPQVKAGGKGTQGGSGSLAFRPGWHLGDLPLATQFARKNPETGAKDLFPADFVWAECEYAMDKDYQEEAMSYGYTENGKFRHSYAGLPRLPEDGYYRYRTNPNPDTIPWVITGAMRVKRILTDAETDKILRDAGVEPMKRQGGELDLERLGLTAGDVENINVSVDVNTHSAYPKLSRKTWTASSYVTDREKAIQQLARDLGVSEKRAANYIDDVNSVARQIADDRIRLDYESNIDETASVIKPNSEYKWSVDMSTLCAKRLLFTGTFDEIQRALPNTVFTSEDLVRLRTMMMERDLEVACGICYVESTRREMGPITQAFIDQYKESQRTGKPITRLNSEGETVELKKTKDQMKTTRDKTTDRFYADKNYTPTLADLNTTDIDFVKRDHPLVYEAYLNYMNARGQAKPKLLETRAEYKGEILRHFRSKTVVDALNRRGGLRIQSFSDFEVPHMIDMMQILLDMSRVGLKSQAYTKVPAFAAVFGNTGMKINLSLIAKGDGLDANGNLIFDDVEGINHEEAFKLRKMYSENVGTILVGKNDAHIIKAMADPRIDFIIPFHKSSWKESLYDALGLTGYEDYTDTQNEKPIDKKRKIKNFDPSEYWDFSKSGDENAQIYLEKCREDGRIPKFPQFQSYPGYWKLLIDFKMYDNEGNGAKQRVVTPDFNMIEANKILEAYEGGHRSFPVAKDVVKDFVAEYKTRRSRKGMSIEEYIEKYGPIPAGEKPYREVSVPRKTGEKEKVSQTVRTVLEAEATPDEMIPTIEELVADGEFSYERYSDRGAMAGATRTIKSKGFETALADWLSEVKQGKVSKRNTVLGWALYNNCANSGDTKSAMTILTAMVEHQRSAAQALQATRILKKMSPTGQLYGAVKIVQKMEDDLNDGKTVDGEAAKRAAGAVGKAKQDAAAAAANVHSGVKAKTRGKRIVIDSNMAGEPFVFEYAQKVGEALAKGLEAKRNRTAKEKTFLQHIVAELNRFASEKLPKEQKGASLTAIDLLRDYIQNQAFYAEAWQAAQITLREKYANDPILSEFINSSIGVDANTNPPNAIFMRALVKAAADSGEGKAVLRRQEALGFTGMADTIADNLIQQTGATGEMADTIRDAAHAYVYDTVNETNGDGGNIVESAIRSAMKDIGVKLSDVVTSGTGETVQRDIVENLVGKYGFGMAEATHTAEVVAERFSQMSKQYAENRLRAMFKPRNNVRKTLPEKLEQLGRLGAFDVGSAYNQQAAERLFKSRTPLTISKYLADKFMDAKTQKERDEIMTEIYKDIGRQMPNSFMDKWRAWRYLAMLGNPRTHVRNIVGNAGFAPMVWTKDLVATGIEAVAGKASGGKMGRTKALPSAELISAAAADFPNAQKKILEGGKYNESEINDAIEEGRVIFKTRVLEKARVGNRKLMEQEDLWFSKGHYAIALAQYCKANSISAQHIRSGKLSDHARAYAIKEAQKATYRDTNAFSEFVSNMGRYHGDNPVGKAGRLLVEGVLPFRKTPANILVRGLEYSPAGFLKGLTWDLWMVRKHAKNPDEGITAAEAIDHISAGFVGTQLVALGAFGAMMGVLRGSGGDDEDQKKFDELQGHQAYSLELEAIDTSVTLDWLAPEVLPLFIGVNIAEEAMRSKEDLTMSDLMAAIGNVTAPMLTMSCLSGLNELFESVSYATNEGIAALPKIAMSAATSLITQAIPTLAGQIERTAQENGRMTTYTDKNNRWLTPDMQYSIGRASSRTPGWDFNQIPYIDAWGRQEVDTNRWVRGLNNFLNPAYVSKIEGGAMEEELQRLYDATGEAKVLPDRAAKYFTVNEKRKDLTAQEYVKYATAKGQKSYELVSKLTANRSWKSLSDAEKVEAISKAYEYANAVAKTKVSPYKLEGANAKIRNSGNDTLYIMAWAAQTDVDNGLKRDGETISNSKSLLQMEAMYALPAIANMDANKRKELFLSIGVGKTVAGYSKDTVKSELGKMRKTAD